MDMGTLVSGATLKNLFFAAAGAFASWLFSLWRNKTTVLSYTVHVDRLAVAGEDAIFGNVEVQWHGTKVANVYLATVMLSNHTLRDVDDLFFEIYPSVGTKLLTERTQVLDSPAIVPYDPEFHGKLALAADESPSAVQLNTYNSSRQYRLPVFNRGQKVQLDYLCTHDPSSDLPTVYMSIRRTGTKLVRQSGATAAFGVPLAMAQVLGMIATLAIVVFCGLAAWNVWVVAVAAATTGLFAQVIGAAAYRFFQRIKFMLAG